MLLRGPGGWGGLFSALCQDSLLVLAVEGEGQGSVYAKLERQPLSVVC